MPISVFEVYFKGSASPAVPPPTRPIHMVHVAAMLLRCHWTRSQLYPFACSPPSMRHC